MEWRREEEKKNDTMYSAVGEKQCGDEQVHWRRMKVYRESIKCA